MSYVTRLMPGTSLMMRLRHRQDADGRQLRSADRRMATEEACSSSITAWRSNSCARRRSQVLSELRERPVAKVLKRPATSLLATASIGSFLLFKFLVPLLTLAQSDAKQFSRIRDNPQPIHSASAFHFSTVRGDVMAVREKRAKIASPVTTFRRALTIDTSCSWASATDRSRLVHSRPGSSFEPDHDQYWLRLALRSDASHR
jgi:hypothetical protein